MTAVVQARSEHVRGVAIARRLRTRAGEYLATLGIPDAELSIVVVTDAGIRALNRRWRGKDRATDVLSFPAARAPNGSLLGDVVVSLDTARRVARAEGRPVSAELDRYLAHGLLHLLGYDHERARDARRMARVEDALVGSGLVREALVAAARGPRARTRDARSARPRRERSA